MKKGKKTVKLRSGLINSKNHFKQLAVSFKVYANFECNEKRVRDSNRSDNASCTERCQIHIPCSFAYKVFCVDDRFSKPVFFTVQKMRFLNSLKQFLKGMIVAKKLQKSILIRT